MEARFMAGEAFDQWAILELMGHVRMAGRVTEETRFGAALGRIDVPGPGDSFTTVYFGGGSIYRLTPTTEEVARAVARGSQPEPVHRWELPKPEEAPAVLAGRREEPDEEEDDGPDDDPIDDEPMRGTYFAQGYD
jgi:hypothetical protein